MANVNIAPNVNQDETDLNKMVKQLLNAYCILTEELTHILNHLDTRNMTEIDGDVLVSGTVTAGKIAAGAITAEKIDVNELSAISANLGHIIAGLIESVEIYGSYIATKKDAYPRAEMSNTNDLFGAYKDAQNGVQIEASYYGVPSINIIYGNSVVGRIHAVAGVLELATVGDMTLSVSGGNLIVPKFSNIQSYNGYNLGAELDNKATAGISTNPSGSHNHGIPDGTVLRKADGGTVTYYAAPPHTHEQTS